MGPRAGRGEAPGRWVVDQEQPVHPELHALVYPSGLDLSSSALRFLSGLLAARRLELGTRWRRLPADRQALLVLAHLWCGHTYAQLAAGFGVGTSTVGRHVAEAVEVLAALAPDLGTAVRAAAGKAFVILDGTDTSLVLALRDMRQANGRDLVTGVGDGNESWIGLSLAMIVLDTLSGSQNGVGKRFTGLLTVHGISPDDANAIYKLRCSLLHGYGPPKASAVGGRAVLLTPDTTAFAVDTSTPGQALVSVPVFCGRLTERIAAEAPQNWDTSLIDTDIKI